MKILRRISALLVAATLATALSAQSAGCNINKTFHAPHGTLLRLTNKYGDINVITGTDDSIYICATITILHVDKEVAKQNIKLITTDIKKQKDTIIVATLYDKKFFSTSFREGRKSFSVDYLVKVPVYADISITSAFGNIFVEKLSGKVNLRLSQGDLSVKKLTRGSTKPVNCARVDHGKVSIDSANWLSLTVRNCPAVSIAKAQALLINSDFSKIRIEETNSLVSDSKSDSYNIGSIRNLVSESVYSTFEIEEFSGQLKSLATFGSITVSDLKKEFTSVDIECDHAPVFLKAGGATSFKSDIKTTNTLVDFPAAEYPYLVKTTDRNNIVLTGILGNNQETNSLVKIRATFGKLSIY